MNYGIPTGSQVIVCIYDNTDGFPSTDLDFRTDRLKEFFNASFFFNTKCGNIVMTIAEISNHMLIILPFNQKNLLRLGPQSLTVHVPT